MRKIPKLKESGARLWGGWEHFQQQGEFFATLVTKEISELSINSSLPLAPSETRFYSDSAALCATEGNLIPTYFFPVFFCFLPDRKINITGKKMEVWTDVQLETAMLLLHKNFNSCNYENHACALLILLPVLS